MHAAVDEMGKAETFTGMGRARLSLFTQNHCGVLCKAWRRAGNTGNFVSDGAKSDIANILELFEKEHRFNSRPCIPRLCGCQPYGRPQNWVYFRQQRKRLFAPAKPGAKADIIYICSPNNPTGAVYNKEQLTQWVKYAYENNAVILFDAAYECFINDKFLILFMKLKGRKRCAIENLLSF